MGLRPGGAAVRAERVVVGTALRLTGVVLVDARGGDDGEPPQHVARGERSATIERRRMTPAFARERPASSLLKPSMRP